MDGDVKINLLKMISLSQGKGNNISFRNKWWHWSNGVFKKLQKQWKLCLSLQKQYQNFLTKHPDGRISRGSFHDMMKVKGLLVWLFKLNILSKMTNLSLRRNVILGLTQKSLSVTYSACMIQTRWVPSMCNAELNNCLEEKNIFNAIEGCYPLAEAK